ncbi:MAG: lipopolysaccharide heptosyltransferase II [Endomicrobiales bacterium]|nr:lipopolysaccharide heptosyltransferase II [Endomicrobiales bacterium]
MTKLISFIGWIIIRLLNMTLRIDEVNGEVWRKEENVVFAFWHGEQFLLYCQRQSRKAVLMSSLSRDGEIQSGILQLLGYSVVRGSSTKGGEKALVKIIRMVKNGYSTAFAVDGPKGPLHDVKPGVLYLAMKSNRLLVPVSTCSKKHKLLRKTWDQYKLPVPFSRAVVAYGKPVKIEKETEIENYTRDIKESLEELSLFTNNYFWSKDAREYLEHHPCPKILIVQPSRIGDVVFALPTLSALRKKYPKAWIGWFVDERCAPVLEGNPDLDEVIIFDRRKTGLGYFSKLRKYLRSKQIDLSIDLHGLFKSAFMVWMAGARFKLASGSTYGMKELSWLFSKEIKPEKIDTHCINRHLRVAEYLGCLKDNPEYKIIIKEEVAKRVDSILKEKGINAEKPVVIMFPGGGWIARRWFPERFSELADKLVSEFGAQVILIGGKEGGASEKGLNQLIKHKSKNGMTDLTGMLNLNEVAALFKKSCLFVGNEAGPMHLACALNVPVVAILGPTIANRTGPYGKNVKIIQHKVDCQPCRNRNCVTKKCMELVTVDEVFEASKTFLAHPRGVNMVEK